MRGCAKNNQLSALLNARSAAKSDTDRVLGTVYKTAGSAYRKAGAMTLINGFGQHSGSTQGIADSFPSLRACNTPRAGISTHRAAIEQMTITIRMSIPVFASCAGFALSAAVVGDD